MTAPVVVLSSIGSPGQQFFDNNGVLLSGGLVYTYDAGTTTPATTYTDSTAGTPNANPVVLDAYGRITSGIWLVSGHSYKIVVKTASTLVTLGTFDNITLLYGATAAQVADVATNTAAIATINALITAIASVFVRAIRITSAQVLPISATTIIQYQSEIIDTDNNYDPTTFTFKAPAAGNYIISASALMVVASPTNNDVVKLFIYNNDSVLYLVDEFTASSAAVGFVTLGDSLPVHLAANDLITIRVTTSTTNAWDVDVASALTITRVS